MILHNVETIVQESVNIHIECERIKHIYTDWNTNNVRSKADVYFDDCIVFPGLINSHDHLDFNLFPRLGNIIYKNYIEWGIDIHTQNRDIIQQVLKIPKQLRTKWGIYKNLLNGITTVVQHGDNSLIEDAPIHVFNQSYSLHSVRLEKRWKYKLNNPFIKPYPFVIHIGEGTDKDAYDEINELIHGNFFHKKLIGIHGVAMDIEQAKNFHALIWCPDSNFFLIGKTAAVDRLKFSTKILFGTDSTLSANWSIWEQLRLARETNLLTDMELLNAITHVAANVWNFKNIGNIAEGYYADIVVAKKTRSSYIDSFFSIAPEDIMLVLHRGNIVYFDKSLLIQLPNILIKNYSQIFVNNKSKYVVGDLAELIKKINQYSPDNFFPITAE